MFSYGNSMYIYNHGVFAQAGVLTNNEAQAFITAANITNSTQQSAIIQLVADLKSANIWSKMKAIYPFVGGTASSHKFNLKDSRDLDAAYRLVFAGGGTHDSNGYLGNATTSFADSKLSPFSVLTNNNNHLSVYSNLANTDPNGEYSLISGVQNASYTERFDLIVSYENTTTYATNTNNATQISYAESNKLGFYTQTRTSSNVFKLFKNTSIIGSNTSNNTSQLPNFNLFIGAHNSGGTTRPSGRRIAFASVGDGLSDSDVATLYNAVQTFNTTLNRQV